MKFDYPIVKKITGRLAKPPRELIAFFATSLAARGVGIACQLAQVPLVMHSLGTEAFGFWMTVMGLTSFVSFADLGLGAGVQNRVAESLANDGSEAARDLFATAFLFLTLVGLGLGAVLSVAVLQIDLAAVFHLVDSDTIAAAPYAALALVVIFCVGFPFGLGQRLAFGRQEGWMINLATATGSVTALGLVALGAQFGWGLIAIVIAAQGALVLANVVLLVVQVHQLRWWGMGLLRLRFECLRELLGLGVFFSVQQILVAVLFALPQVVISATLGAAAVTPYNLAQRLFNLCAMIQNAFMLPLWPAYSRAKAKREFAGMRATLGNSIRAVVLLTILPMAALTFFAGDIIRLWVGESQVVPGATLLWLLFSWNAVVFLQQPFGYLLAGVSEVRRLTTYLVCSAILSTALMILLARPLGGEGVVLGLLLGYLPFGFAGSVIEAHRYLKSQRRQAGDVASGPYLAVRAAQNPGLQ